MSGVLSWLKKLFTARSAPATDADTSISSSAGTSTEFTAEVVRITQVLPHPNADRLEIARFEMKGVGETTYEVVIQKGQYKPGSLAIYFSVDCILPREDIHGKKHTLWTFLFDRLDGKNKDAYRLRAARLRGVFSQGLLVGDVDDLGGCYGDPIPSIWGVTYYRAPEPKESLGPTGKTVRPRVQPVPIYGVESLKKVPRLFAEGEKVLVTEKIHGTNFRFGWVRRTGPLGWLGLHRFVVGSHRVIKDGRDGGYYGEDLWTQAAKEWGLAERTKGCRGYVFYGEIYGHTFTGQRIQDLTYGRKPEDGPALAIFDVLTPTGYMGASERIVYCGQLGLPHVPVYGVREYDPLYVVGLSDGESVLSAGQIREGVVVEALEGPRRKAKYVGSQYLMRKDAA